MLFLYNLGIKLLRFFAYLALFINNKAKKWVDGQKDSLRYLRNNSASTKPTAWFHFASLGEFEQGRPVLEDFKKSHPEYRIVMTFFSPSGYEIRKNYALADVVLYLPADTAGNARLFVQKLNPSIAVFTKYEYWYHYFKELSEKHIPLIMVSAIFRPEQAFFKWYGGFYRKILNCVTHFFVQNEESAQLLSSIGLKNHTPSGDTRFDRVAELAASPQKMPKVEQFVMQSPIFIAGSTWPEDENLLCEYINSLLDEWKYIIAPHEVDKSHIKQLLAKLKVPVLLFSELDSSKNNLESTKVLIVDSIGLLSSIYQFGNIAYIGGGFGKGIHNTLEAAVFGMPIFIGPKYQKFNEAVEMVQRGCGLVINGQHDLNQQLKALKENPNLLASLSDKAKGYVSENTGGTQKISAYLDGIV